MTSASPSRNAAMSYFRCLSLSVFSVLLLVWTASGAEEETRRDCVHFVRGISRGLNYKWSNLKL